MKFRSLGDSSSSRVADKCMVDDCVAGRLSKGELQ